MKNIAAVRVVAFDEKDRPITTAPAHWSVKLDLEHGHVHLSTHGASLKYELAADTQLAAVADEKSETATGGTAGRIALTGIAASLMKSRTGSGGSLLDLRLAGDSERTVHEGLVIFKDTTAIGFTGSAEQVRRLLDHVPSSAKSEAAAKAATDLIELAQTMALNGEKALSELQAKIILLQRALLAQAKQLIEGGANLQARDAARTEAHRIGTSIADTERLMKLVAFQLASPSPALHEATGKKPKVTKSHALGIGALVVALIAPVAVFIWTPTPNPSRQVSDTDVSGGTNVDMQSSREAKPASNALTQTRTPASNVSGAKKSQPPPIVEAAPSSPIDSPTTVTAPVVPSTSDSNTSKVGGSQAPPIVEAAPPRPISRSTTIVTETAASSRARVGRLLDEGEFCISTRNFTCAIGKANQALNLEPNNGSAKELLYRAEWGSRGADID
jgi:hypothetical protein